MEKKNENIMIEQLSHNFPFSAPDGYFDNLPAIIMERIEAESKPPKELFFIRFIKPSIGLAAGFLIIMGLLYIPVKLLFPVKNKMNQSTVQISDEEYLISYPLSDRTIFESLESNVTDVSFNNDQLETVLLASVTEYDLIDLNN